MPFKSPFMVLALTAREIYITEAVCPKRLNNERHLDI